jgi:hypothetical protein
VWSYTPRSLTDIQSLVSAIQSNNPSLLSSLSDLMYVPAPYFVGQVSATQVAAFIDNAIRNYGLAGAFASFISNYPYGLWSTSFVSNIVTNPYLTTTSVVMLITNQGMSANSAQFILYQLANNYDYNKWVYTVTYNAPSITFSANATLSTNVLIAQNITIASGVTVTCGTTTCFFIAQNFNNYGTITAVGAPSGGGGSGGGAVGGTGGGGVVVVAITAVIGTINVNGSAGGTGSKSTTNSLGCGGPGAGGAFAIISGMSVPEGGTGYGASISTNCGSKGNAGYNGGGGGGLNSYYPGGGGGNATVSTFSNGNALLTYILHGLGDYWLINVRGLEPSSSTPLLFVYGSGGGGGGGNNSGYVGYGGGGGGGGEVIIYGNSVIAGNVNAYGGNGGGGGGSGGGGAGGIIFVFYGPGGLSGTMSYNVSGGSGNYAGSTGVYLATSVTVNG